MTGRQPQQAAHAGEHNAPRVVVVYDGRTCLGHVLGRGKARFEALDADNCSLGIFLSQRHATSAIMRGQ